MVYCSHCADYCPFIKDPDKGYICCGTCGKVIDQEIFTDEPTFFKDSSGASRLAGNILSSIESGSSLSHERTLMKGRDEIWQIVTSLHVGGGDTIIDMAHKFYTLAVDHNFTRGRRTIGSGEIGKDYVASKDPEVGGENGKADADPESFSDIDDVEVDGYLHNEEETQYKKIIWEEMNKEYLEEQAAKEALAAELAARGVGVGEGQQKKRRRNEDMKNSTPAETPAEATYNMLKRKGLGSKINVEAVGGLYNTKDEASEVNEKGDMGFDGEHAHDTGDGETLEGGYDYADYNNDGYADGGDAGAYEDYDGIDY